VSRASGGRGGGHIDWHFDHSLYHVRHFTVLICRINQGGAGGASACTLLWRDLQGGKHEEPLGPGDLVAFEGARIRHKATPLRARDLRVMLSMTFATGPRIAPGAGAHPPRERHRLLRHSGPMGLTQD